MGRKGNLVKLVSLVSIGKAHQKKLISLTFLNSLIFLKYRPLEPLEPLMPLNQKAPTWGLIYVLNQVPRLLCVAQSFLLPLFCCFDKS